MTKSTRTDENIAKRRTKHKSQHPNDKQEKGVKTGKRGTLIVTAQRDGKKTFAKVPVETKLNDKINIKIKEDNHGPK